MSIYACLGSDAAAIRDAFLTRLQSKTEDMRIKVMILEFLTVAVETQPGLIELFLNLEAKDGSEGSKVSEPSLGAPTVRPHRKRFTFSFFYWRPGVPAGRVELPARGAGAHRLQAAGEVLVSAAAAPLGPLLPARAVAGPPGQRHLCPPQEVSKVAVVTAARPELKKARSRRSRDVSFFFSLLFNRERFWENLTTPLFGTLAPPSENTEVRLLSAAD